MQNKKTKNMVILSLLIAIEAVLVITNWGFIIIPPVSITILHIPVIVGAIIMGPYYGSILGASFGLLSLLNATFRGASPVDLAFSPFTSGHPVKSIIMCMGCRILLGFMAGLLFQIFSKMFLKFDKHNLLSTILSAFIATFIHTASVMLCLWFLFPNLAISFKAVIETILAFNFLIEAGIAIVFSIGISKVIPILKKSAS